MATTNDSSATWAQIEIGGGGGQAIATWAQVEFRAFADPALSDSTWAQVEVLADESGVADSMWAQVEVLADESGVADNTWAQVEVLFQLPVAVVATPPVGVTGGVVTFDGSASEGGKFRWKWTSVPFGSVNVNSQTAYPDSGAATPIDMTDNKALYHLDTLLGLTFADTSGNANTATVTAGVSVGTRGTGASAAFAAQSDTMGMATPLVTSGTDWSIGFWFKGLQSSATWRTGTRGAGGVHHIIVESGSDRLGTYSGGFIPAGAATLPAASYTGWNHIALVSSGTSKIFFINGIGVGSLTLAITDPVEAINNHMPGVGTQLFADEISEVSTWSRPLTAKEAWDIYALQEGSYIGPTGKTDMLSFTADKVGAYDITLDVAYGDPTISSASATAIVVQGPPWTLVGSQSPADAVDALPNSGEVSPFQSNVDALRGIK